MRLHLLTAALLLAIGVDASGQAYKWVDRDGRVHYTQTPPPPDAKGVQRKNFRSGPTEAADLPYATRLASTNFPVTIYTSPDCGNPCDRARALLVRRAVPFREVSVVTQKDAEELKNVSGRSDLPTLVVGTRVHVGFQEGTYNGMLEDAGYPSSVAPLPIEALRKTDSDAKAPPQRGEGAPETTGTHAAGR
jgi:glutaredoxin